MRVHLQRVSEAQVQIDDEVVAKIAHGLLLLVGFSTDDDEDKLKVVAQRVLNARVFADHTGRFQYSVGDVDAALLVVPQFTLYGRLDKGRRPDFGRALAAQPAAELFASFVQVLDELSTVPVLQGRFGANMQVGLVNDGPVTLLLDTDSSS